jgi:hypothetical protein
MFRQALLQQKNKMKKKMKKTKIFIIILGLSFLIGFYFYNKKRYYKTNQVCLEAAKLELQYRLKSDKFINCFSLQNVNDLDEKNRRYRWIKTWKNKSDTISIVIFINRDYGSDRYSHYEGNQDIWKKLNLVDLRKTKMDSTLLDQRDFEVMKKYKDYAICN